MMGTADEDSGSLDSDSDLVTKIKDPVIGYHLIYKSSTALFLEPNGPKPGKIC